jgi:plasmid maintenance system antidote protein VapI
MKKLNRFLHSTGVTITLLNLTNMITKKMKSSAMQSLEKITGPLTLGKLIHAIRICEEKSLVEFSKLLKITVSHLCDIEKGRKTISPERATRFAKALGRSEEQFVQLALQSLLDKEDIHMQVTVKAA